MCVYERGVCITAYVWKSEDNLWTLVHSLHHVDPGLGDKYLFPLISLTQGCILFGEKLSSRKVMDYCLKVNCIL